MSRKRKRGAKATAASMVMDTLKKRVDEKSAVDVSVFKNLPYATSTISYTISNLMEEGVVGKTDDERFYYDDLGFKALETKFVRGYSMIFIVPIVIAILVYVLQKVL
jgi:predicted transcriptional regulator